MSTLVVDASVVAKWFLPEEGRPAAMVLFDSYLYGEIDLKAPALLAAEVTNVFAKRYRRKELTLEQARTAFVLFEKRLPTLVPVDDFLASAYHLSLLHHLAVYDCLYLALAMQQGCDLITADDRLFRATAPAYPFVRLLSTIRKAL